MKVMLIACTPDPEKVIAAAAKTCYTSKGVGELYENLDGAEAAHYVDMLSEIGHESPIEHASFTFAVEGISRSCLAQLTRHRLASYSVRSQRYVSEKRFEYVTPPEIADCPEALALYEEAMEADHRYYEKIAALLSKKHEEAMAGREDAKKAARKKAQEDARFVLPNACTTQLVMTMNARELKNFFAHRCCNRAQWEIRELAERMLRLCQEAAPHLFRTDGPPCVRGACPEGRMSCGQAQAMREKYGRNA